MGAKNQVCFFRISVFPMDSKTINIYICHEKIILCINIVNPDNVYDKLSGIYA